MIINWPPRNGKSFLVSKWTPLWFLDNMPNRNVILTAYEAGLAAEWGRKCRNEIERNQRIRITLSRDSSAAHRWNTPQGGGMITAGVGGPVTGHGGDLIIVDDPLKNWQDAYSFIVRNRTIEWFNSTLYSRCEPNATIIIVMQRWHEEDLTGYLINEHPDDWQVIRFPALAEENDALGRVEGDPLCPRRYTREAMLAIRSACPQEVWESMYQQCPGSVGIGRVYGNFTDANIDINATLRDDLPLQIALDFNVRPGMHLEIGQYDNKKDEFVIADEIHEPRMHARAAAEAFVEWVKAQGGYRWPDELHIFGDASGQSEWTGTGETDYQIVKQVLKREGIKYRIRVPKANPGIKDSMNAFNDALCDIDGHRHYRVHPRCKRLLADFKNLKTDENGLIDKHVNALSHACLIAETMIATDKGDIPIEKIKSGMKVLTRKGYKKVLWSGIAFENADIITVNLSNGKKISGTKNHPIWVKDIGFVPLELLKSGNVLYPIERILTCKKKQSSTKTTDIHGIRKQSNFQTGLISKQDHMVTYTDIYGSTILGQFPMGIISTTKTRTLLTILLKIWNVLLLQDTPPNIRSLLLALCNCGNNYIPLDTLRQYGTDRPKEENGIGNTLKRLLSAKVYQSTKSVSIAEKHSPAYKAAKPMCIVHSTVDVLPDANQELITRQEHVNTVVRNSLSIVTENQHAVPVHVESVSRGNERKQPVYDITVEGSHEFFANGILAHNSDACRYHVFYLRPMKLITSEPAGEFNI